MDVAADFPAPAGFRTIDDVVEGYETDELKRQALAQARSRLAEKIPYSMARLLELRLKRGLSQRALAKLIGTSQSHIARIETGREDIRMSTLRKLAAEFNVPVGDLASVFAASNDAP